MLNDMIFTYAVVEVSLIKVVLCKYIKKAYLQAATKDLEIQDTKQHLTSYFNHFLALKLFHLLYVNLKE